MAINIFKKPKTAKIVKIITWGLLCLYAVTLFYLYYNQTQYFKTNMFESDLPFHLKFAVEDKYFYSFTTFLYLALSKLPLFDWTVALFLTLATIGSVLLTEKLIKKICQKNGIILSDAYVQAIAFIANVVIAFYIPWAGKSHYVAYQSGNLWHNSTYIFMRFFALITLLIFTKYLELYKKGTDLKLWFSLSISLMITTGIKASFFTVFGPVMAIILLFDLIKGVKFKRVFAAALTVIPSCAVILYQNLVLFGSDTGNCFAIRPFYTLSLRGEHPKVTFILSILFPLMVGVLHVKEVLKNKYYFTSLLIFFFGFIEVFLFAETGSRGKDGNFLWGYSISIFFIFVMSLILFIKDIQKIKFKNVNQKKELVKSFYTIATLLVLLWHLVSGIWYYVLLLTGVTYFV